MQILKIRFVVHWSHIIRTTFRQNPMKTEGEKDFVTFEKWPTFSTIYANIQNPHCKIMPTAPSMPE